MSRLLGHTSYAGKDLPNRLALAPMTRNRANADGLVGPLVVDYYRQRATAGLVITEATQPSQVGQGYPATPGLHSAAQTQAWHAVTDAVHGQGSVIVAQLMHAGRIGHPAVSGLAPVAPSPVPAAGQLFTFEGMRDFPVPQTLTVAQIDATIADFAAAARNAVEAGFDGVELHGANGYLLQQFLADNTNRRTDSYGAGVAGRIRFVVEVTQAVAAAIGAERVGLRLSPGGTVNDIAETTTEATYPALVSALADLPLAHLHLVAPDLHAPVIGSIRSAWPGTLIINHPGSASRDAAGIVASGEAALDAGADLVAIGSAYLANPDLPERLRVGATLNSPDRDTYYGGDAAGYTDYPRLDQDRDGAA